MLELLEPFFGGLAPIAWSAVLVSLAAGALSPVVVMNRMAFFSDAIAHSALLGVTIGIIAGLADPVWPMLGMAIAVGIGVGVLRRYSGQSIDTLLGVAMAAAMAVGLVLYHRARGYRDLHGYLWGDIAVMSRAWFVPAAIACGLLLIFSLIVFNRLAMLAVSREIVRARGLPAGLYETALIVMLAVVVTLGVRSMGILMINAMLVIPGASARNMCASLGRYFWLSAAIGLLAGLAGVAFAYVYDLPPGPSIVTTSAAIFIASLAFVRRRKRGQP